MPKDANNKPTVDLAHVDEIGAEERQRQADDGRKTGNCGKAGGGLRLVVVLPSSVKYREAHRIVEHAGRVMMWLDSRAPARVRVAAQLASEARQR